MTAKFLPLNIRFRILKVEEAMGTTTLMCVIPDKDPLKAAKGAMSTVPCQLEIALIDPDDGKEKWYAVPFEMQKKSIIELDTPMPPRKLRN